MTWSHELCRIFGVEPGLHPPSYEYYLAAVHPDDRAMVDAAVQHAFATGQSYGFNHRVALANGSVRIVRARGDVVLGETGAAVHMAGTAQDVTVQEVAATARDISARRQSDELRLQLAAIVDSSGDAIVSKTLDGVILSWNNAAEKLYGYTAEEIIGKPVSLLVPADRPGEAEEILARVRRGEAVEHFESMRVRKDGGLVPVSLTISPVRDASGLVVGASSIARDTTERDRQRQLEASREQALEASRLKSEFLATMSHEIRTPMNGVIGMAGLLLGTELDVEQHKYAQAIHGSGEALLSIINDILDFSKIEAGYLEIEEIDFDLAAVVDEVAELLACAAHDKGLELIVAIDPAVTTAVRGDPSRLRQVLVNLVANAVKFTATGEVVVALTATATGSGSVEASFEVRDTGIGISTDLQARVFESFTQLDASTSRRYGGTGLGLTISRRLVGLMGGTMAVVSSPGVGSAFSFTVALREAAQPAARGQPSGAAAGPAYWWLMTTP